MTDTIFSQCTEFTPIWIYMLILSGVVILTGLGLLAVVKYGEEFLADVRAYARQWFTQEGDGPRFLVSRCRHSQLFITANATNQLESIGCALCGRGVTVRTRDDGFFVFEETEHGHATKEYQEAIQMLRYGGTEEQQRNRLAALAVSGRVM